METNDDRMAEECLDSVSQPTYEAINKEDNDGINQLMEIEDNFNDYVEQDEGNEDDEDDEDREDG